MYLTFRVSLILLGLILWLIPWPGQLNTLRDVGKWTYVVALAAYLFGH